MRWSLRYLLTMGRFREIERKFDTQVGTSLPDLSAVDGVAAVTEPTETTLEATYFDTPPRNASRCGAEPADRTRAGISSSPRAATNVPRSGGR